MYFLNQDILHINASKHQNILNLKGLSILVKRPLITSLYPQLEANLVHLLQKVLCLNIETRDSLSGLKDAILY